MSFKIGKSMRDGQIDVTCLAKGFHEGLFVNLPDCRFGISGPKRMRAKGNVARPTKVDLSILLTLNSYSEEELTDIVTVKYAGTPVYWTDAPKTERQKEKNNLLEQISYIDGYVNLSESSSYEVFGGGIFGMNDPIGLGKKFSSILKETIIAINLNYPSVVTAHWRGKVKLRNKKFNLIIGSPREITLEQAYFFKKRLTFLLKCLD